MIPSKDDIILSKGQQWISKAEYGKNSYDCSPNIRRSLSLVIINEISEHEDADDSNLSKGFKFYL